MIEGFCSPNLKQSKNLSKETEVMMWKKFATCHFSARRCTEYSTALMSKWRTGKEENGYRTQSDTESERLHFWNPLQRICKIFTHALPIGVNPLISGNIDGQRVVSKALHLVYGEVAVWLVTQHCVLTWNTCSMP